MSKEKKKEDADMKMMKKLATFLLAVCLVLPCFSMVSFAANGVIQFTDPSTTVGETLEVICKVKRRDNTGYGKVEITMTYDTSMLKFKSGNGITEEPAGTLTYSGDATNDVGPTHEFRIKFDVLKAGTTKITITEATVKSLSGSTLDYSKGSSTITIAEGENPTVNVDGGETETGEPTGAISADAIEVNGKSYTISNTIPENEIPEGYEASTLDYDETTYDVVYSEGFGLYLAYMVNADNVGGFFMYVEEDATFAPYEEVSVSDSVRIALLSDVSDVALPSEYASTEVVLNEHEFPAWQNQENTDFCILYAINSNGEKSLYQLDNAEGTYQRFAAPEVVDEETDNTFIGKLSDLLENHMDYVILGTGLGFILFVIIIVILSVKLYNRNAELDEIYDEYGIDEEDDDADDLDDSDEDYDFEYDYDENEDDEEEGNIEMEKLVQAGMKEVFPEEDEEDEEEVVISNPIEDMIVEPVKKVTKNTVEIPIERVVEKVVENERTLGEALAKQKETKPEEDEYYDEEEDDDVFGNFSMNFIDLDD